MGESREMKRFRLGVDVIPTWFNEQAQKGRAKLNYEDEELVDATVYMATKTIQARIGDTIVLTKAGLGVVRNVKKDAEAKAKKEE